MRRAGLGIVTFLASVLAHAPGMLADAHGPGAAAGIRSADGLAPSRDPLIGLPARRPHDRLLRGAHFGGVMAGRYSAFGVPRTADPEI